MGCKKRLVKAGKRIVSGATAPLVAYMRDLVVTFDDLPADVMSNHQKREAVVAVTLGKKRRGELATEMKEGGIRAILEVILDAAREGVDAAAELGVEDQEAVTEEF